MPVSLAEDLDAIAAFSVLDWGDREAIRQGYAATLVKRQAQRPTFETLFDLYFPRLVGEGVAADGPTDGPSPHHATTPAALEDVRARLADALADGDQEALRRLAAEAVGRFGAMRGRGPGLSSWSAYTTLQRVSPQTLVDQVVAALLADGRVDDEARRTADRRVGAFAGLVEADARRRIAAEKGPDHVARVAVRPSIDRLDFTSARKADLAEMRREIYPLARRLATRMARERHARRRGPLDFRRTVRRLGLDRRRPAHDAPQAEAAAPHRARRALRRQRLGGELRAVHADARLRPARAVREGARLHLRRPGARGDRRLPTRRRPGRRDGRARRRTAQAALWGRTNYGRAFATFAEEYADALGPRSSLLILGDARSNYSDLGVDVLKDLAGRARHAYWLNPEHPRHWDTGDSAAGPYGSVVPDGRVPQPRRSSPTSCARCADRCPSAGDLEDLAGRGGPAAEEAVATAGCASCSRTDGSVEASTATAPRT